MISIIIPLYNKEAIIERSLRSALSQDYKDFEVIIVDDGSTDKSAEIVQAIHDHRIQLIYQKNGGPSKARNTGISNSNGAWIVFLDADDELLPGALKRFSQIADRHPETNFIACPYLCNNGNKVKTVLSYREGLLKNPYKSTFLGTFFPRTGAFACKRDLLLEYRFNKKIRRFEDLDMLFRLYHRTTIFLSNEPAMIQNSDYAAASRARKDIKEDFLGYLEFKGKSFWERMCLYKFFLSERPYYPKQCRRLYPHLYHRWDYFLMYQFLTKTKKLWA